MAFKKDKKVDKFVKNLLMEELAIDEEKILSRLEFEPSEPKTPWYKKINFMIPTLITSILILILLISTISITIYKNISNEYKSDDLVFEALELFEDEITKFSEMTRLYLVQTDNNFVFSIYYSNVNYKYYIISYNKNIVYVYQYNFNNNLFTTSSKVDMFEITLEEINELIIHKNGEEIYNTTFKIAT